MSIVALGDSGMAVQDLELVLPAPSKKGQRWQELLPYSGDMVPAPTPSQRRQSFGQMPAPETHSSMAIRNWQLDNITSVRINQLSALGSGAPMPILINRRAVLQIRALFKAWEDAGLVDRIQRFAGSYRGVCSSVLDSGHEWGSAFDLNGVCGQSTFAQADFERLAPLAEIANQLGVHWGGHNLEPEPFHFEVAQLLY